MNFQRQRSVMFDKARIFDASSQPDKNNFFEKVDIL